jgi:hypothetical protein
MARHLPLLFAAAALLSAGGCAANLPAATATASAPAASAAPPTAPPVGGSNLATVGPEEMRAIMVDLNLAHAMELCGFPALGSYIRDELQRRIDTCPNTAQRKAALQAIMASAALHEQRLAADPRARGEAPQCYASDKLTVIKEMIPVAQRVVARAQQAMDCTEIGTAER